jgi:hypothetical protein
LVVLAYLATARCEEKGKVKKVSDEKGGRGDEKGGRTPFEVEVEVLSLDVSRSKEEGDVGDPGVEEGVDDLGGGESGMRSRVHRDGGGGGRKVKSVQKARRENG